MKNCLSCDYYSDSYGRCRKGYSPGSCERELAIDEDYSQMIRSEMEKKKEKKITNGDRIRNMNDKELAKFLCLVKDRLCFACKYEHVEDCEGIPCEEAREQWLKMEVPENDGLQL